MSYRWCLDCFREKAIEESIIEAANISIFNGLCGLSKKDVRGLLCSHELIKIFEYDSIHHYFGSVKDIIISINKQLELLNMCVAYHRQIQILPFCSCSFAAALLTWSLSAWTSFWCLSFLAFFLISRWVISSSGKSFSASPDASLWACFWNAKLVSRICNECSDGLHNVERTFMDSW